jgi:hypothetical protein
MNLKGIVRSLARRGRDTDDRPVEMHSALDDWLGQARKLNVQSEGLLDVVSVSEGKSQEHVGELAIVGPRDVFWEETEERGEAAFRPFNTVLEDMDIKELRQECQEVLVLLGARQYLPREETD